MDILSSMNFRQEGRADEYGLLVRWQPVSAMGALYLVAIEGDNFHQGAVTTPPASGPHEK